MHIRQLTLQDVPNYIEHLKCETVESGRDGVPIFHPYNRDEEFRDLELSQRMTEALSKELDDKSWIRAFGLFDGDVRVGHLELKGASLKTATHRALIGMGIEQKYCRKGWGQKLMQTAIEFARELKLEWLDLYVFEHNTPARKLYQRMGFSERGKIEDYFRVDGQSITDIAMALKL